MGSYKQKSSNKKKRKSNIGKISECVAHVNASFNNIKVTVTTLSGDVLVTGSSGAEGFRGAKKNTPHAATKVGESVGHKVMDSYSAKTVVVVMKGIGGGKEYVVKGLAIAGLIVTEVNDRTPIPHNGCRSPKRRRV